MTKLRAFFFASWRPAIVILLLAAAAYAVFFNQLGSLVHGYSMREVHTYASAVSGRYILEHPLNAPYTVVAYIGHLLAPHNWLTVRIAAALFGILAGILFFAVIRVWFTFRDAFLATILFVCSSALMHFSRLGSPLILQTVAPLTILALATWVAKTKRWRLGFYVSIAVLTVLLYIPGLIWFVIFGLVFWQKRIRKGLKKSPLIHKLVGTALGLALLAPLISALIADPTQIRGLFGLPEHFSSLGHMASNLWHTILAVGVHSYGQPDVWLGHAPLIDIIQLILLFIGIYAFARHHRLGRSVFILFGIIASLILTSLGGPVKISLLMPFLYVLIAGGLYKLLQDWLAVFPRNPIARFTGIAIVCVLVFFSVLYQWRAYFVAWPHNTATKTTFSQHRQPVQGES